VEKEETRIGDLTNQSEYYPSLAKFWHLICIQYQRLFTEIDLPFTKSTELLANFDECARNLIVEGYHIETMAVNPQMRSCWKNYAHSIYLRCNMETDRQRQQELISQQADIPTANADEEPPQAEDSSSEASSQGSQDESDEEFSESEYQEI